MVINNHQIYYKFFEINCIKFSHLLFIYKKPVYPGILKLEVVGYLV